MKGFAQKAPRTDVTHALFDSMVVNTTADPSDSDFIVSVVNEYFPLHKIRTVASDATAFPSRGEQNNVLIVASWTRGDVKERTERARKIARELVGIIGKAEGDMVASENHGYVNYGAFYYTSCTHHQMNAEPMNCVAGDDDITQDRAKLLYGPNYARLQALKQKYDPEKIFNRWFVIEPASA